MKRFTLLFFAFTMIVAYSRAQSFDPVMDSFFDEPALAKADKEEIDFEELPSVVQNNFHDSEYAEWLIHKIYAESDDSHVVSYEIVVSDHFTEQSLCFDELGNLRHIKN